LPKAAVSLTEPSRPIHSITGLYPWPPYRTFSGDVTNTYSTATRPPAEKSQAQLRASEAVNEAERSKRSKATPNNVALPRTVVWAAKLPGDVQPQELIRSFGRIANLLAANWDDAQATAACFNQLLTHSRGYRRGFPPKVVTELLALQGCAVVSTVGSIPRRTRLDSDTSGSAVLAILTAVRTPTSTCD
jgi:hypothetical protein